MFKSDNKILSYGCFKIQVQACTGEVKVLIQNFLFHRVLGELKVLIQNFLFHRVLGKVKI